jgi:hypothetical protein
MVVKNLTTSPEHANAQDAILGYLGQHNSAGSSAQLLFWFSSDGTEKFPTLWYLPHDAERM